MRTYAELLEILDPFKHNAEQEFGHVLLTLSYNESAQQRLETLEGEAGRLKLAVAGAKCEGKANANSPVQPDPGGMRANPLSDAAMLLRRLPENLVPQEGFEPPTHALRMRCSTPELLRPFPILSVC